jgi:DNA-binding NarL/FixJ family response regulator
MSASDDPVHDGPADQERLEDLFGTVFGLADQFASRISSAEVEVRLRRTLQEANHQIPGQAAMTDGPPVLPLAGTDEPVCYVLIDDEPRYRQALDVPDGLDLTLVGSYKTVEAFLAIQRQPCHVVVLDLCLNGQIGDEAVLQGVRAIRELTGQLGHRVVVSSADARPEPVARCVAAGAAAYISKYDDPPALARAVDEVGRHGSIVSDSLHQALRKLTASRRDIRLPATLEETLTLLETGMSDREIARMRQLSVRTIEDHRRKILEIFGTDLEARLPGFAALSRAPWHPARQRG